MLASGHSYREVRERLDCSDEYIREWKKRFQEERLAGLDSRYRGSQPRTRTVEGEARILEITRQGPADGTTHWSSYRPARKLGISQSSVSRVWRHFGIQPHRSRGYMASDDPEFEEKAADIIGLYIKPPATRRSSVSMKRAPSKHSTDLTRFCRSPPGRAERHGFEYFRHRTLSLYAALDTRTGDVIGKTTDRHTSVEFVDFLSAIVASQPAGREIHIVADNLSAHKTKGVFEFLNTNPAVRIHYTPTYSSWLNQVEIWFSKIQRAVIARGIFTSKTDLSRKLLRYIKQYNKTATPFHWGL